jgi:hypothetical protein
VRLQHHACRRRDNVLNGFRSQPTKDRHTRDDLKIASGES